jgi:hypothetical protein
MRFKLVGLPVLALSILSVAIPAFSQVAPEYERKGGLPIEVGAGGVSYDVDWGHGRMYGGAAWIDYYPRFMPSFLRGLGIEGEVRDITLDEHTTQPNMRQDTGEGGPIYAWRHFRNFHPYAKYLIGDGSIDFWTGPNSNYRHDTRILQAPGGGLEVRLWRAWWMRADYEYQTWPDFIGKTLDPQGFTVGFAYDFAHSAPRKRD